MESYKEVPKFGENLQQNVLAIIFFAILILLSPLFILIVLILFIWRIIVAVLALMFKDLGPMMSGAGVLFLVDSYLEKPHCALLGVFFLEGKPDIVQIRENWKKIMQASNDDGTLKYDRLWQYPVLWLNYAFWKLDSQFDIENHVKFVTNPELNENTLEEYAAVVYRSNFAPNRPLWDVRIIPKYNNNEEQFVAVVRVHHIVTDGLSAMKLLLFAGKSAEDVDRIQEGYKIMAAKIPEWSLSQKLNLLFRTVVLGPYIYVEKMYGQLDKSCIQNQDDVPPSGNWMFSFFPPMKLEQLKTTRRALKMPMTAIILRAFADALKIYIEETFGADKVPEQVHVLVSSPLPHHPDDCLVNYWTFLIVKISYRMKTILGRLQELKYQFESDRDSAFPVISRFLFVLIGSFPKVFSELSTNIKGSTYCCTNVPGPSIPSKLFDYELSDMLFCMPMPRSAYAISIGIVSYNGSVRITCGTDKSCIPDKKNLNHYADLVRIQLANIMEEAVKITDDEYNTKLKEIV